MNDDDNFVFLGYIEIPAHVYNYAWDDEIDEDWHVEACEESETFEALERCDFERELIELVIKRANSPEGLSQGERERQLQLIHYLQGNSWDSYTCQPENLKLKKLLGDDPEFV